MLTDGIMEIKRKEVDCTDPGSYNEPYLTLEIGDVEIIEKIIEAVKTVDPRYGNDIEVEYKELDNLRGMKRKEYGDLPVPDDAINEMTERLVERFYETEDMTSYDIDEEWDEVQKGDWELPKYLPEAVNDEIMRNVQESIREQKEMADNDELMRKASYIW